MTFHKGYYLTASQGATFSKGWNDGVAANFTNTTGDLANEGENLKYLDYGKPFPVESPVDLSKLYKESTMLFIKRSSADELFSIALRKLKSNFNPFPELPKPGILEKLGIVARMLWLMNFALLFVYVIKFRKTASVATQRIFTIIFAILVGQTLMSVYIYTGLRFNSIYSLVSLCCPMLLVMEFIRQKKQKQLAQQ